MLWQKKLYERKNKNKNNELVKEIKNRLSNLKDEIKKMSEDEKETETLVKILKIVEEVPYYNKNFLKATVFEVKNTNTKPNA